MVKNGTQDMTTGNPSKIILGFSIPLLLGMLFQQFYSMTDTIIVGKYLGVEALAAVGSTSSINFMIIGFCMGICNGFAIPVAQKFGASDYKLLRKYVVNSAFLSIIISLIMTVIVCVFCREILVLMKTPSDIIDGAYEYIFIIFLGIPATYLYNLLAGIIRSFGDSKTPLYFLFISSVLNIILGLYFIAVLDMGIAGSAWATVISEGVSGICCLVFMKKKYEILKFEKDELQINTKCISRLCYIGIPMGLQYSITAIGSVILQTSVNHLGSAVVAAVAAASKISAFLCCPFDALGSTMATYAGQNVGARKLDRVSKGIKSSLIIGSVYAIIALTISSFFGRRVALIFIDSSEVEILSEVVKFLIIVASFYIPLCFVNVVRFTIQGMGYSTFAILAGVCEMIARTLCGFVMVPIFGYIAVCLASPFAWICADAFLIPAYKIVLKKMKKEIEIEMREEKMLGKSKGVTNL